jgi:hypothetical protein
MLRWFRADLHIHTCLSPCGELIMSPRRVVEEARARGIDLIAVTDHNSAGNAAAVLRAAEGTGVSVLPGLEVCSSEEVHVLALFDGLPPALELQEAVYRGITAANEPEAFGLQVIANEHGEVEGFEQKLLIGATALSINEVVTRIHDLGGVAIASHVDRESYGIIGHLGFIPPDVRFDALEISENASDDEARRLSRTYDKYEFIRSSDAHAPGQIGKAMTSFLIEKPTCGELQKAFRREGGRSVASSRKEP